MCLDHVIAHDTYHFFPALPLEPNPTCITKQCGIVHLRKRCSHNHQIIMIVVLNASINNQCSHNVGNIPLNVVNPT